MPKAGQQESWRQWSGRPYNSPQIELAQVELTSVEKIFIEDRFIELPERRCQASILTMREEDEFAMADGFRDAVEMREWFEKEHGLPFGGILIKAKDLK